MVALGVVVVVRAVIAQVQDFLSPQERLIQSLWAEVEVVGQMLVEIKASLVIILFFLQLLLLAEAEAEAIAPE